MMANSDKAQDVAAERRQAHVIGTVTSDKMDKTISVQADWSRPHPLYGKIVRRHTKYKAHDEKEACCVGDIVEIAETRPLSRTKRWRLVRIVRRGPAGVAKDAGVESSGGVS